MFGTAISQRTLSFCQQSAREVIKLTLYKFNTVNLVAIKLALCNFNTQLSCQKDKIWSSRARTFY
jgi:hypothetical protein